MALNALPILVINLGGEMMYILDQRLRAQNIQRDKGEKVVNDIVKTMFDKQFMEEIFKPQELYSKHALRSLFEKIAHASIMKLNTPSMDKLYDLMTMVFKYQIYICSTPVDLLTITLNHLDAIRKFIESRPLVLEQIDSVESMLMMNYQTLSLARFQLLRYTLLSFFQDLHIRVSVFLKEGIQHQNARFKISIQGRVPHGFEVPGIIREFGSDGSIVSEGFFPNYGNYLESNSLDPDVPTTTLGTNIYATFKDDAKTEPTVLPSAPPLPQEEIIEKEIDSHARKQLNLMAHLIGQQRIDSVPAASHFSISMFDNDNGNTNMEEDEENETVNIVNINISKSTRQDALDKIIEDLRAEDGEQNDIEDDLLDLMDHASCE